MQNPLSQYFQGLNPLADQALNGYNYPQCPGYLDQAFFPAATFVVPANSSVFNQIVPIDTDADFIWRGFAMSTTLDAQFSDSENYSFSQDFLPASVFSTFISNPFPIFPHAWLPAGGKASFNLRNTTGGQITTTITLVGCKRYKL